MALKLNNIPLQIGVPGGAPQNLLAVAAFLTQLVTGLNAWVAKVATALNELISVNTNGTVTEVNTGTGLTGGPITSSGTISLQTPVSAANGGTGSSSGITLTGDVTGGPNAPSILTTLATVNADVGTFQGLTVNGKGLVTAASNQGYWVADTDWSFSSHALVGNLSGSAAPTPPAGLEATLVVVGAAASQPTIEMFAFGGDQPNLYMASAQGTPASPTAVTNGTPLASFLLSGYNGTAWRGAQAQLVAWAGENWTSAHNGTYLSLYTTPNTTTSEVESLRIVDTGLFINSVKQLRTVAAPAHNTSAGVAGDCAWDSGFFYICIAANSWARVAIGGAW